MNQLKFFKKYKHFQIQPELKLANEFVKIKKFLKIKLSSKLCKLTFCKLTYFRMHLLKTYTLLSIPKVPINIRGHRRLNWSAFFIYKWDKQIELGYRYILQIFYIFIIFGILNLFFILFTYFVRE